MCLIFVLAAWIDWAHIRVVANTASLHTTGANHMAVLPNLAAENEALKAELAAMQALMLAASKPKALTMKVSEKGALSIYGLGRFPITLYRGQMERLLAHKDMIEAFITTNAILLSVKA